MTGFPVIAEDSGLLFMDLAQADPDQPGQFVRRFHGKSMTDEEMLEHYIDIIHRHGGELRACWLNCWCLLEDQDHGETYENRIRRDFGPAKCWQIDPFERDALEEGEHRHPEGSDH